MLLFVLVVLAESCSCPLIMFPIHPMHGGSTTARDVVGVWTLERCVLVDVVCRVGLPGRKGSSQVDEGEGGRAQVDEASGGGELK